MKEANVHSDTSVTIHDAPIPSITHPSQIIIRVIVSGCNPKDWKMPANLLTTISNCPNSGDDIAGIVHEVGSAVTEFKPGDRVAALHELGAPGGSYAEFAVAWDHTTFHLGDGTSFEEAASVPMGSMMASIGLFGMLKVIKTPWTPVETKTPLVIYGAAGTVGAYAIKLASLMNVHPLICVAGRGIPFVETLIDKDKGDVVLDYRNGPEELVQGIKDALQGSKLQYAFDAVSEKGSYVNICEVLDPQSGKITLVLPFHVDEIPKNIEQTTTMAGVLWDGFENKAQTGKMEIGARRKDFAYSISRFIGRWLNSGELKPHPYTVSDGGLLGIETALKTLRDGKGSATKYVVRVANTPVS